MRLFPFAGTLTAFALLTVMNPQETPAAPKAGDGKNYFLYVGTYGKGIELFRFDASSGDLKHVGMAGELVNPSFLVTGPEKHHLFAVSELTEAHAEGAVAA